MDYKVLFFLPIVGWLGSVHAQSPGKSAHQSTPVWQKGVNFTHAMKFGRGYGTASSRVSLQRLKTLNVEWLAIVPYCYQPEPTRAAIIFMDLSDPRCTSEKGVRQAIRDAHALGFKILLKPHLWVGRIGRRERIRFKNRLEQQKWFANYERLLVFYANLAREEGVEMFCVGVELNSLTLNGERYWRAMIKKVRQIYSGPLVYAANWNREFQHLRFWDALDYMGLDYYFPMTSRTEVTLLQLIEQTEKIAKKIERVQQKWGKPVIFTEVGFKSAKQAAWRTWEWEQPGQVLDMKIQAQAYHAIFEVYYKKPWFFGMYWWKWSSDFNAGGRQDVGFTPKAKPAEKIIRFWYALPMGNQDQERIATK